MYEYRSELDENLRSVCFCIPNSEPHSFFVLKTDQLEKSQTRGSGGGQRSTLRPAVRDAPATADPGSPGSARSGQEGRSPGILIVRIIGRPSTLRSAPALPNNVIFIT